MELFGQFGTSVNGDRYGKPEDAIKKTNKDPNQLLCDLSESATAVNDLLPLPKPPCEDSSANPVPFHEKIN